MTTPTSTARLTLSEPGDLIAALPALLGFPPHRSLVLVCLNGPQHRRVGLVARLDLPHPERTTPADRHAIAEQLAVLCARQDAVAVVLTAVEDRHRSGPAHQDLLSAVRDAVEAVGTEVLAAHHVRSVHAGARWRSCFGDPRTGRLPDPASAAVTAAHVAEGRVVHASRAELCALLDPRPEPALEELLAPARAELVADVAARGRTAHAAALRTVLAAVAGIEDGTVPGPQQVAVLAAALSELAVRDACMALPGTDHGRGAELLWLDLTRRLPAPVGAEAATLLAHSCYTRGEGPLAGEALGLALAADPGHRMAQLLAASLQAGVAPDGVRALCATAAGLAAELGVPLPPQVGWV